MCDKGNIEGMDFDLQEFDWVMEVRSAITTPGCCTYIQILLLQHCPVLA